MVADVFLLLLLDKKLKDGTLKQHGSRYSPPLARLLPRDADPKQKIEGTTNLPDATPGDTPPPYIVNSLTEAIALAVISGICGPSLFALIGCGIRQIRLTWDDPFAGGERPVDEAAERRKRKKQQQQEEQLADDDDVEIVNNNIRPAKAVVNNADPLLLDRVTTLDLDKIRAKPLPASKFSNTEKNLAGKVNKGYSKTAEDIL
ncbi:uncharacterized protein LOC110973674 isoform X2 [Acanthaster planci]|uniref:Uncharacterized protein LOC110973674 isoform X2 n=1 Tax=Acanthaster planci TaxID=133434 RepID=A0A8B7XJQ7_ACAPL|nr:uncharacterized protein LOC110973674 isoform X2 [Acanthaster planci]